MSWPVSVTHHVGLPLPGSPLVFLVPQILCRATMSRPHPSGEGRGERGSLLGMLVIVPTSINRREGQAAGCRFMHGLRHIRGSGGGGSTATRS